MSVRLTALRTGTALALVVGALAASSSSAATPGTQTLYARGEGCGTTAQAGRLETSKGADGSDGCGTIGGLPLSDTLGATPKAYSTPESYKSVVLGSGKVVGQVAADSWTGVVGGVGTVTIDVSLSGFTAQGDPVDIGSTTVTAAASPTTPTVKIPFELAVPAEAVGSAVSGWSLSVTLRGRNVNANAQALEGDVFATLPIVKP